jgi:hypothetical protein
MNCSYLITNLTQIDTAMKSLIEKIFRREQPNVNYIIGEYKPSRGNAMSKPARKSEYDVDSPSLKDEMEIDNIYQDT